MYSIIRYGILVIIALGFIVFSLVNYKKMKASNKQKEFKYCLIVGIGLLISAITAFFLK